MRFSLRSLFVLVLAVACFLGGMEWQKRLDQPEWLQQAPAKRVPTALYVERIRLSDGTIWHRSIQDEFPNSEEWKKEFAE